MYDVSSPFLDALAGPTLRTRVTGTLTLNDSTTVALSDASFLAGSLTVSNQCSEGSEIKLGGVYVGQLDCTLLKHGFSRRLLRGATISLSAGLLTADGWEDVPLGVWTVGSATWRRTGVAITAYDTMSRLDADCSATAADAEPYDLLSQACTACGVTLSDSRDHVRSLPNGEGTYNLSSDNDITSWRDWVSWVAQLLGGFATIDRSGGLHIGSYGTDSVLSLTDTMRTSDSTVEDYETRYTGMSVVWQSDSTTRYYSVTPDDGLTYDLGTNPWLQSSDTSRDTHMTELVSAFARVSSTPMGVTIPGIPFLDLGDMVTLAGGLGLDARSNVMNVSWTPHKGLTLTAYGSDPGLSSARSKTDKDLAGLLSTVDQNTVAMYAFTNKADVDCMDGESTSLVSVSYTARKDTLAVIHMTIQLATTGVITTDGDATTWHPTVVTVTSEVDDVLQDRSDADTWTDGHHVMHVMLTLQATADSTRRLEVMVGASGGGVHVEAGGVHGLVEGVGLAAQTSWDGTLVLADTWTPVAANQRDLTPSTWEDSVDASTQTPIGSTLSESTAPVEVTRSLTPVGMLDLPSLVDHEVIATDTLDDCTIDSGSVPAVSGLVTAATDSQVTSWLMGRDTNVTGISGVTANTITGDVTILVSFDRGATWKAWDGIQWAESSTGMDATSKTVTEPSVAKQPMDVWYKPASSSVSAIRVWYRLLSSNATGFVDLKPAGDGFYRGSIPDTKGEQVKLVVDLSAGSYKWDVKGLSGWSASGSAVTLNAATGGQYPGPHTCATAFAALDPSAFTGFDPATGIMLRIIMPSGSSFSAIGFTYTTQEQQ